MEYRESRKANRLIDQKSPYLLQHAYNPIEWYSWGEEAFEKARRENKPVFLSCGYSTCHWCHVMERESFEDDEVAKLLNNHFVPIKVDREERPDIDNLYMLVCQALTGHGGWPLTVFLTADQKPFYAGTYFPKRSENGRIGLIDLLEQIVIKWDQDGEALVQMSEQLLVELEERYLKSKSGLLDEQILHNAFSNYLESYDPVNGGFGTEPKFPTPHQLSFLLAYGKAYLEPKAIEMATHTLDKMHRGGLYDHIGFGFSRYSTDDKWLVPHFEKMLYDNGLLAIAYLDGFQSTGQQRFAEIAESIFTYVLRDMTSLDGAFYSAEDADSEGVEGKFYLFTRAQIREALELEDAHLFCHIFDITPEGTFDGANIPNLIQGLPEEVAAAQGINPLALKTKLEEMRVRLFEYRERRVHPAKDDKVLTTWNGLMIAALARGAKALQKPRYAQAAKTAADWIWKTLRRPDGRLLARYRDGEAAYEGYIDDYAYLQWGLIELYEATADAKYLDWAIQLKDDMLTLFWDTGEGGFYFSGTDGEKLFATSKEIYDGALPSGNSVAALQLYKLAGMTQDARLQAVAKRLLQSFAGSVMHYPTGHAMYLQALLLVQNGGQEIVLSGHADDPYFQAMVSMSQQAFLPGSAIIVHTDGERGERLRHLLPHVVDKTSLHGQAAAYICRNFNCEAPIMSLEALRETLLT